MFWPWRKIIAGQSQSNRRSPLMNADPAFELKRRRRAFVLIGGYSLTGSLSTLYSWVRLLSTRALMIFEPNRN
jgi:hypothetical protein